MESKIFNPFGVTIDDIILSKFSPTGEQVEPMSILPQVGEFVLYQSVFSPILKAQLAIYDAISLLNNYPMVGEETIEVVINQRGARYSTEIVNVSLKFIIVGITGIQYGETGRDQTYMMELHSVEAFENAKRKISKAYKSSPTNQYVTDILTNYLKTVKPIKFLEGTETDRSSIDRVLVVPNLRPLSAITWLTKNAVPANPDEFHNYVFYETIDGTSSRFNFKPFQKQVWKDSVDQAALTGSENHPYFYISNYESIKGSPGLLEDLARQGFAEERLIINLNINKRYSVIEKIIGGYFENEYVEIDMGQKMHQVTQTGVTERWKSLYSNYLQTDQYINDVTGTSVDESETSPRTKYAIFNYDKQQNPNYNLRWGKQEISKLATSQIDLSIDIHTNLQIVPGDLIYLNIPEQHGFNEVSNDRYINGHFYITEAKTVIRTTGETTMLLRVNKDSYFTPIVSTSRIGLE